MFSIIYYQLFQTWLFRIPHYFELIVLPLHLKSTPLFQTSQKQNTYIRTQLEMYLHFIRAFVINDTLKKLIRRTLSEVNFARRQLALLKNKTRKRVLPFVTTYQPSVRHLKKILMLNSDLMQNQPLLNTIFRNPPIIAYKRATSFNPIYVALITRVAMEKPWHFLTGYQIT